jgi:ferritin
MESKLRDLIEDQINKELFSAYLYFDIAEYYRSKGLDGFHVWFEKQATEEIAHAERFAEFMHDKDQKFSLKTIEAPKEKYADFRAPLLVQIKNEAYVTSLIDALYREALAEKNLSAANFLLWYITEQTEEEKTAKDFLTKYDLYGKDGGVGLHELDEEAGKRK